MPNGFIINVSFEGIEAVIRKARNRAKIVGPAMTKAMTKVKFAWLRGSKVATPVDTGRLRASEQGRTSTESPFPRTVEVGSNVQYAVMVHEGTRFMRARPFFVQGFANAERDIDDIFEDAGEEIERAWQTN